MEFQNRLYDLRKRSGLSQEELANLVGVTRQAVQKWEAGTSRPDMDNLTALARYFNVTLDWLITGHEMESCAAAQNGPVVVENHYHYNSWHYEYKSKCTVFGLPLAHINLAQRGFCVARGVVAIGNVSVGALSIGVFALGGITVGAFGMGLLALAGMALGLLAMGGIALGYVAVGGCAFGYLAIGGSSVGIYAAGGAAMARDVAVGSAATADLLAIGQEARAAMTMVLSDTREAIFQAIGQTGAPDWIRSVLMFCIGR